MYAQNTTVSADKTKTEIERVLIRYGASHFAYFSEPERAIIIFHAHERRLRFDLPLPTGTTEKEQKICRQKWRALLLCIKAKLEAVESKIESFEEAFLAHVVMPDGMTVGQHAAPRIATAYKSGEMQPLLPAPNGKS
jgi:hypothetical protein